MSAASLWSGLGLVNPLNARIRGRLPGFVGGISIDSRSLEPGDLFFAIKGENADGHAYVADALAKGAAAAVVDESHADALKDCGPLYIVPDVLASLEDLGRAARARSEAAVVAVTGSVGKTSTKEALRVVLSRAGPTHASLASLNNHWGVPLTLARLPAEARYAVFELGMNHAGELMPLTRMVRPHVAIITTVAPVHLEFFASVEAIADAKAEIFAGLKPGGTAIIHRDIPQFERLLRHAEASLAGAVLSFGETEGADARLAAVEPTQTGSIVTAEIRGRLVRYRLGAPGRHLATDSLAVLLAAAAVGLEVAEAAEALANFEAPPGRGRRLELPAPGGGTLTLIDESYNANPVSLRAALALLGEAPVGPSGRRVAVLGDMLELGPDAAALHRDLAGDIADNDIDVVYAAGSLMKALFDALPPARQGSWSPRAAELEETLFDALAAGDVVMVKGSHGSRMGEVVHALRQRFAERGMALAH